MFAVSPQNQGKGYGRALLKAFIEEAEPRRVNVALAGVDGACANTPQRILFRILYTYFSVIRNDRSCTVLQEAWICRADACSDDRWR